MEGRQAKKPEGVFIGIAKISDDDFTENRINTLQNKNRELEAENKRLKNNLNTYEEKLSQQDEEIEWLRRALTDQTVRATRAEALITV